jgi:outer membrane protein
MHRSLVRALSVWMALAVALSMATPVAAQPMMGPPGPQNGKRDWAVVLGGGVAVRPTFEGSDRYRVTPVPFFSVTYRDMVSLDATGLNAYWRHENLQIGGGITYNLGRTTDGGYFGRGDSRLAGMGDVPVTVGIRGFANYRLGPVLLGTSITKFFVEGNNGLLIDGGIGVPYRVTDRLMLNARLSTTWADGNYMRNFFGVTAAQSAASGFAAYDATSGIKDINLSLGAQYRLTEQWLVSTNLRFTQLLSSAKDSPISFADRSVTGMLVFGYRF